MFLPHRQNKGEFPLNRNASGSRPEPADSKQTSQQPTDNHLSAASNRLNQLGWTHNQDRDFAPFVTETLEPGRIIRESRQRYTLGTATGDCEAQVAGRLIHRAGDASELPVIGDWVAIHRAESLEATISAVLPRASKLSRKVAGRRTEEQVIAANVDTILLVMGLDGDYNLRRLERFMVSAWESGAQPMVVLNKADVCNDVADRRAAVETITLGAPVLITSCSSGDGIEELLEQLQPGQTVVVSGSSGVGKSTLINCLLGNERLRTGAVREGDDRGRHTTTHRELVALTNGTLLIDSPGIRELQLWNAESGMDQAFGDIQSLAIECRFNDCTHHNEPGCAVRQAIDSGRLDSARLRNLHNLEKEQRALELRQDSSARRRAGKQAQSMFRSAKRAKDRRKTW